MKTTTKKMSPIDVTDQCQRLKNTAREVHTIGQVIQWQDTELAWDDDMLIGIGEILERISKRIYRSADRVERQELKSLHSHDMK